MPRFSDTVMAHFEAPSNRGRLEQPDGVGLVGTPGAGPFFLLGLSVAGGRVTAARFECHGCGAFVACGSVLTELVVGRDVSSNPRNRPSRTPSCSLHPVHPFSE